MTRKVHLVLWLIALCIAGALGYMFYQITVGVPISLREVSVWSGVQFPGDAKLLYAWYQGGWQGGVVRAVIEIPNEEVAPLLKRLTPSAQVVHYRWPGRHAAPDDEEEMQMEWKKFLLSMELNRIPERWKPDLDHGGITVGWRTPKPNGESKSTGLLIVDDGYGRSRVYVHYSDP
jgi:hypothetical protein